LVLSLITFCGRKVLVAIVVVGVDGSVGGGAGGAGGGGGFHYCCSVLEIQCCTPHSVHVVQCG